MKKWKDISGYEGRYLISDTGEVASVINPLMTTFMKPNKLSNAGYYIVSLSSGITGVRHKTFGIHRLVAMAFLDNPNNKRDVNHKNSNKTDNRLVNLEWTSRSENMLHAVKAGKFQGRKRINNTPRTPKKPFYSRIPKSKI